jgi:hypothetical protein
MAKGLLRKPSLKKNVAKHDRFAKVTKDAAKECIWNSLLKFTCLVYGYLRDRVNTKSSNLVGSIIIVLAFAATFLAKYSHKSFQAKGNIPLQKVLLSKISIETRRMPP